MRDRSGAALDPNVERGADCVAVQYLRVRPGEVVHVMTWESDDVFAAVARGLERAGGVVRRARVEALAGLEPAALQQRLDTLLAGATATMLIGSETMNVALSKAIAYSVHRTGARHIHMPRIDLRVLGSSVRADPDLIRALNERLTALLTRPARVRVTSDAGTDLEVTFGEGYTLHCGDGRPAPGDFETLPTGYVYTHPSAASGTYVADRMVFGSNVRPPRNGLRRNPLRVTIAAGRVSRFECDDAAFSAAVEAYLASHPNAGRVGLATFSTNYVARTEMGHDIHDGLLPGLTLSLGYTDSAWTRAPFDAPVQLRLMGRKQTVEIAGRPVIVGGRFENSLVEGLDPFR